MHKKMVERIIRSKILFFDSNPIGRIFTRFSKDIAVLDIILPAIFALATFTIFRTLSVFITVVCVFPIMLVVVVFALAFMMLIVRKGAGPMRECLRMDSLFRGPVNSQFAMIVNGLVSLRTYERIAYFRQSFIDDLEKTTNVTFSYYGINRWMGISLDMVCIFFSACTSCFTMFARGSLDNETLAFAL